MGLKQQLTKMLEDTKFPQQKRNNVQRAGITTYEGFVLGDIRPWAIYRKDPKKPIQPHQKMSQPKYKPIWALASKTLKAFNPAFHNYSIQ